MAQANKAEDRDDPLVEHHRVIAHVGRLSALTSDLIASFHKIGHSRCPLCGSTNGSLQHTIWDSKHPTLVAERKSYVISTTGIGILSSIGSSYQRPGS